MGTQVLAIISTVVALWFLLVATLAALQNHRAELAEAPTAAFAKDGDDRSLPPIFEGLRKRRHALYSPEWIVSGVTPAPTSSAAPGPFRPNPDAESISFTVPAASETAAVSTKSASTSLLESKSLVPAFFVYGDSTVDSGNNNYLQTIAKANLPPYGRDFDTHLPTGRFSNGRLSIDYLAAFLGLPFVQPLLSSVDFKSLMQGVNFASAGAGILTPSGSDLGQHIPMAEQVQHVIEIQKKLNAKLGEEATNTIMSESIHYISIGSNDFIHYYLRNVSDIQSKMTNFEFNQLLISTLMGQIEDLYIRGIRKIAMIGVGPLGCVPYYLYASNHSTGDCVDSVNFMVAEFNNALRVAAASLALKHINLKLIYCDIFDGLLPFVRNPTQYGFVSARTACCGAGRFGGWLMCMFPQMACADANGYLWWDEFHPTDRTNSLIAKEIWSGKICDPINLQELAAL